MISGEKLGVDAIRAWLTSLGLKDLPSTLTAMITECEAGNLPVALLWSQLAKIFQSDGLLDNAREAAERALNAAPAMVNLRAHLARLEFETGNNATAQMLANSCRTADPSDLNVALLLSEMFADPNMIAMTSALMVWRSCSNVKYAEWGVEQVSWVKLLRDVGTNAATEAAASFILTWVKAHGSDSKSLIQLATVMLELGRYDEAGPLLCNLWRHNHVVFDPVIGPFTAGGPPDAKAVDTLRRHVITALNQPEEDLPIHSLPVMAGALPDRVMYLGPQIIGLGFPNDVAFHLTRAANAADRHLSFDSDLTLFGSERLRISDAERSRRIDAMACRLRTVRPQVLILDCCWPPTPGHLDPLGLIALKAEIGCRVLCLFRDAHSSILDYIRHWTAAADGVVFFDPLSSALLPKNSDIACKAIAFPVPVLMANPVPLPSRGLLFIGSLAQYHRSMLIGALLVAGLDFTAIVGNERLRLAPDYDAYSKLLASSRAVLNIAVHHEHERLVTGRCWETIAVGGLLLEQAGSGLNRFFAPYRHYIPWTSHGDIATAYRFLEREDELRQAMIASAQNWAARHYSPKQVWSALMALACR